MGRQAAAIEASLLRKEFVGIEERYFDLPTLVREFGIDLRFHQLPGNIEGMSLEMGGRERILIDPSIDSEERKRFTLAHEFGHQLRGHAIACSSHGIHGRPDDPQEQEANEFATELLMPRRLFRPDIRRVHPRLDELSQLADTYGVSLTAGALRYTSLTKDFCALICFRPPEKPWFVKSPRSKRWWLNLTPPEDSLTAACLRGEESGGSSAGSAKGWLENYSRYQDWEIREEVIQVLDTWLVLLGELPDPDDDPDLEERHAVEALERRRNSFRRY